MTDADITQRAGPPLTRRAALAGTLGLIAASCSGDDDGKSPSSAGKSTSSTSPTPKQPKVWPLTGLEADGSARKKPVLAVKVDNTGNASPQVGLADADLVVEEMVEGGSTRLVAMYHSKLPDVVVPVRSVRTTDIGLVKPTNGALVASGGAGRVLEQMDDAGVTVIEAGAGGFSRAGDRSAPYNMTVDLATVRDDAGDVPAPDQNYLSWGSGASSSKSATQATVEFSPAHSTQWEYDGDTWRRTNGPVADGDEFAASTLLIVRVATRDAGYEDPAGNFVPEMVLTGKGDAVLLTGGKAITGTWSKDDAAAPFVLHGDDGSDLNVPRGRTWIELVPEAGSVSYS